MRWFGSLLCCVLVAFSPIAVQAAPSPAVATSNLAGISSAEMQVVNLVNAERAKAGLPGLQVSAELTSAAQSYSAYMAQANFFAHVGPDGSTLTTRDPAAGYTGWTYLGENLAAGQNTPEAAVAGWMNSPTHKANILNANYKETGVGYASGGSYGHYWTQEFGARNSVPSSGSSAPSSRSDTRTSVADSQWTSPETGHTVSGAWLDFVRQHGGIENFGYPRTETMADPTAGGQTTQYFQRLILEYHPENPAGYQLQRRLLGDILYPGADPAVSPNDAPPGPSYYFPVTNGPTGLGHFVANYTRSGQAIYFKDYFDSHGGVDMFGYPKEEPKIRDGIWTQRFQAAVFQYHPEYDRDGYVPGTNVPYRTFRVQLELLGDEYINLTGLPFK